MSVVYVTADWHIGHEGITEKYRTEFPSTDFHDDFILDTMRAVVTKRDVLYVLGDVTWTHAGLKKIKDAEFPCKMIMIAGNHDTLHVSDYLQVFDDVRAVSKYKGLWLTHIPIHPQELYRGMNIHGHCHRGGPYETEEDTRYFNAILEFNNYMPINMQKVPKIMADRHDKKRMKNNEGETCTRSND